VGEKIWKMRFFRNSCLTERRFFLPSRPELRSVPPPQAERFWRFRRPIECRGTVGMSRQCFFKTENSDRSDRIASCLVLRRHKIGREFLLPRRARLSGEPNLVALAHLLQPHARHARPCAGHPRPEASANFRSCLQRRRVEMAEPSHDVERSRTTQLQLRFRA
jgi:hypothetical protein